MTRVAIVTDRHPPSWGGGVSSAHFHLARLLAAEGMETRVFAVFDALPSEAGIERAHPPAHYLRLLKRLNRAFVRLCESGKTAYQALDIAQRAWGSLRLRQSLARFRPDAVILPDHGAPGLWLPVSSATRRIVIAHHNPSRFIDLPGLPVFSGRDIKLALRLEARVLGRMTHAVCPSRYMFETFRETHAFMGGVTVIPNLVDSRFLQGIVPCDPRSRMGLPPNAPLIYVPAGGNAFKGAGFLPLLFTRLAEGFRRPFGAYITGHVPEALHTELRRHIAVHAPGPEPGDALLAAAATCSFGLYPTLVENYSMALLEAVALGLPMLSFAVGGNAEIVRNGVNGTLASAFDAEGLAASALALLNDPARLSGLHETTRKDFDQRLDARHHLPAWRALLAS